jgi:hypothetical protein
MRVFVDVRKRAEIQQGEKTKSPTPSVVGGGAAYFFCNFCQGKKKSESTTKKGGIPTDGSHRNTQTEIRVRGCNG